MNKVREIKMKNILILFAIVLVGTGATAGAFTSASLGWTLKSIDKTTDFTSSNEQQSGNIILELPDGPLTWVDPDETIADFGNITVELPKPVVGDIRVSADAGLYSIGANVTVTLENTGDQTAYFYGPPYHWTIDKYTDGTWKRIYPNGIELLGFFVTQIGPGEKEVDVWDQQIFGETMSGKVQVDPGNYRVVVNYCMGEEKYEFTEFVYFLINNYEGAIDFKPIRNIKLKVPDYLIVLEDHENMLIPLPPMQTMPLDNILPKISTTKIPLAKYCNATDSITIYNITDSVKIYDPDDGYWRFPVFPYLLRE